MAVVIIGNGAHAQDIISTLPAETPRIFEHHTHYIPRTDDHIIIAINNPRRRSWIAQTLGVNDHAWVHPHTWCENSHWDHGTHINYAASMTRTSIGHHCTISPGVTICGDVTIGDRVLIGAGATICDRVQIGDDVTIGAGCVILPESIVPPGSTVVGVPAKHLATGVHIK